MKNINNINRLNNQVILDRLYSADELDHLYQVSNYIDDQCKTDELIALDVQDRDGLTIWIHATDLRTAAGRRAKEIIREIIA